MISYEELSQVFDMDNPLTLEYFELCSEDSAEEFVHKHHILPKSLFPDHRTSPWNIVKINYKQHVKAHEILPLICLVEKHKHKMVNAYFMLRKSLGCAIEDQSVYDELKRMQRESKFGSKNPMYGKSPSPETRAKTSKATKGRKKPDTMRERLSIAKTGTKMPRDAVERSAAKHRGRKASEEHRRKLSVAQTGRKHSEDTKRKQAEWHKGRPRPKEVVVKFTETKRLAYEARFRGYLASIGLCLVGEYVGMSKQSVFRCRCCDTIFRRKPTSIKHMKNCPNCKVELNDKT